MSIVADPQATIVPAGEWTIDPVWSSLEFEVKKLGLMTVKGRAPSFTGSIQGGDSPVIEGTVDATSITTFDETRDGHLQSPDFFDTQRYPELRFESTSVSTDGDGVVVEGNLTVKGITKPVELTGRYVGAASDPWGNERIGLELEGTIDRTEFGLRLERTSSGRWLPAPERHRPQGALRGCQGCLTMRILAVSGSLREQSYNSALARAAQELAPGGVDVELFERLREIPHYDADLEDEGAPQAVQDLRDRITDADAVLFVTPEYNGSVPGVLKNAIDWASRPPHGDAALWGKTAAVAGATTGQYGALWAQQDLRRILGVAGARVIEGELSVARAQNAFDSAGRLTDALVAERLEAHLESLVLQAAPIPVAA